MQTNSNRTGVLLINLGTPAAPDKKSVRAYLAEFLHDRRVIDLPALWRYLLVEALILPFRPQWAAQAYQQIWTSAGSPLLVYSQQLAQQLAAKLGENYLVALGMRYGKPDLISAIHYLKQHGCRRWVVMPLFPQYASAVTGSALEKTLHELQQWAEIPQVKLFNSFYDHPGFIKAWRAVVQENLPAESPDVWIFSYHGLPIRQLDKRGCDTTACLAGVHCVAETVHNHSCYRRQCFATSQLLAQALGLAPHQYRVSFQSRLGRTPWITPYTDRLLPELAATGVKKIAVVCPSFVVDCLETLEEIGIRARNQWQQLGGTQFTLIPCLNHHPVWIEGLVNIVSDHHEN
jgi:protoporphyrin/coproporphyrin ferrochelatase